MVVTASAAPVGAVTSPHAGGAGGIVGATVSATAVVGGTVAGTVAGAAVVDVASLDPLLSDFDELHAASKPSAAQATAVRRTRKVDMAVLP